MVMLPLLLAACSGQPAESPQVDEKPVAWLPSPPPPDDVIYFVLVDRFANGNTENDSDIDKSDPQAFHGGDITGVIEHLDELKELGVGTIWLSPVFDSRTDKFFEWGAFHGYWVEDYGKIEPRFGTTAELKRLSAELHQRDMRLVLDVVFNHVAMDAQLEKNKPDWFHPTCDITDWHDARQLTDCRVHGLPDLNQENEEVYQYLLGRSLGWIEEVQPDGFRIDAVRHMKNEFLERLSKDIHEIAGPGFLLLGEDFEGDALKLSQRFSAGGFGAMFDFPLHYAMLDTFCQGRPPGRIAATLSADHEYENPNRLVPFLDNHDRPRLQSSCDGDEKRVANALTFLFTTRGIPSLTYGTEVGLDGAEEPHNRQDMLFGIDHPQGELIKKLIQQRRAHKSLQEGTTRILALEGNLFAYARIVPSEAAIVLVNVDREPTTWPVPLEISGNARLRALDQNVSIEGTTVKVPGQSVATVIATRNTPFDASVSEDIRGRRATEADSKHRFPVLESRPTEPGGPGVNRDIERSVQLTIRGGPPHSELFLVGNGARLGNWDPKKGLGPMKPAGGGSYVYESTYRVGGVMEFKVVKRQANGHVTWQEGENQYLFVGAGKGPMRANIDF
ncbi:MAG: glycosyl hydrolase [Proteobacteria bacterium]|nr:glycosyl hydrolase [Pseudomonadota bacterium]